MKHNTKRKYEFLLGIKKEWSCWTHKEGADPEYCLEVITNDDALLLEILRKANSFLLLLLGRD